MEDREARRNNPAAHIPFVQRIDPPQKGAPPARGRARKAKGWYQSIFSKNSFSAPHTGQTQSSGTCSQGVPGSTPLSGECGLEDWGTASPKAVLIGRLPARNESGPLQGLRLMRDDEEFRPRPGTVLFALAPPKDAAREQAA